MCVCVCASVPDVSWIYASHHIRHIILSYSIFHSTFYKLIQYSAQRNLYHQHGSLILCICHFWPFTSSSNECDTQKAPGHEALLKNQLHILLHRVNLKPAMAEAPGTKPNAAQNKQWDICFQKIPKVSKSHVGLRHWNGKANTCRCATRCEDRLSSSRFSPRLRTNMKHLKHTMSWSCHMFRRALEFNAGPNCSRHAVKAIKINYRGLALECFNHVQSMYP